MDLLERIDSKLDKIQEDITSIKLDNAKQSKDIERNTKDLSDHIEGVKQNRARIREIEKTKSNVAFVFKVLIGITTIVGAILGVVKYT